MTPRKFVDLLAGRKIRNVFNPYADRCGKYDGNDAPSVRRKTLRLILEKAARADCDLWVGRDFGWRGGRRTGLAMTDDVRYGEHLSHWGLSARREEWAASIRRGELMKENTAGAVWSIIRRLDRKVFLWNVFPFHPHEPGNPYSNRLHAAAEREIGKRFLSELVTMLAPSRVVAVGRHAESAVPGSIYVRHPSCGGQAKFAEAMKEIYGINDEDADQEVE